MPRPPRIDVGGELYHIHNRANKKEKIFYDDADYIGFEKILFKHLAIHGVLCRAYVIMPNHWHLLVKTYEDGDLGRCMQAITQEHAHVVHAKRGTTGTGHVYQDRYKSHRIGDETYFLTALKYIERNPVRAGLCVDASDWQWGSAFHRINKTKLSELLNADIEIEIPRPYKRWINTATSNSEVEAQKFIVYGF